MIRRPPRSTQGVSSAASDVYKRQKFVCLLTAKYGVPTVASLNSIMVDATGMCGACMVPFVDPETGKLVRKHACIDGPELDGHAIDWDKFLPRFNQFKTQEKAALR